MLLSYRVVDGNPDAIDYNLYTAIKVLTESNFERIINMIRTQNTILIEVKIPHDLPVGDVIKVTNATHIAVGLNSNIGLAEVMGSTPVLELFKQYVENLSPILK